jgi:hypothetical protein
VSALAPVAHGRHPDRPFDRVPNGWSVKDSTVRMLFALLLAALLIPSKLMALAHAGSPARLLGSFVSSLAVYFLLYRLCLRVTHQVWFLAVAIAAAYVAAFGPPALAWCALGALYLVHCLGGTSRSADEPLALRRRGSAPAAGTAPAQSESSAADAALHPTPRMAVVPLESLCRPYARFLLSGRVVRAVLTCHVYMAVLAWAAALFVAVHDGVPVPAVLLTLAVLTLVQLGVGAFAVWFLCALWRGSMRAARIGLSLGALAMFALPLPTVRLVLGSGAVADGTAWYHLSAVVVTWATLGVLTMGSATLVLRRGDVRFMRMIRLNAGRGWRATLSELCGVIPPRVVSPRALADKGFVLSLLAFCLEGMAFYPYLGLPRMLSEAAPVLTLPFSGTAGSLERHYFPLATIAFLFVPAVFVWTHMLMAGTERLRKAARRAAVRSAEQALADDQRPPVLFLRAFDDDQVSLATAQVPAYARAIDPGMEQRNLEEVLQVCLGFGPIVAIGRPQDDAPPLGAARRYVRGDRWRDSILALMDAAAHVVVGVSESHGVVWEIGKLAERGHLEKCVFVIPPEQRHNRRLVGWLLSTLLRLDTDASSGGVTAAWEGEAAGQWVAAVAVRQGTAMIFVSTGKPSPVQYETALRLASLEP